MKFIVVFLLVPMLGISQSDVKNNIQEQAQKLTSAVLSDQFQEAVKHTHPSIIDKAGGVDAQISQLKANRDRMKKEGVTIELFEVGENVIIDDFSETESHCIVPLTMKMKVGGKTITIKDHFFGFSDGSKERWVFCELQQLRNPKQAQTLIPNFKTNLKFPQKIDPVYSN